MHPNVAADFAPNNRIHAPNNRIHAPNRSIDMHPKGIDMHPDVSIYFAPNNRILAQVAFLGKTLVFRKNMQNLHVHKKSHIEYFGKKVKNYNQHCFVAHIVKKIDFLNF